jgi:hypothetical protein
MHRISNLVGYSGGITGAALSSAVPEGAVNPNAKLKLAGRGGYAMREKNPEDEVHGLPCPHELGKTRVFILCSEREW